MLRRLKCFLLASCVLALLATMFFQLHGQGMHVQIWHRCPDPAEELKPNVSRESSQVLLFPAVHSKDNPVPPDTVLQQMSHKDVQSFYHGYVNGPQVACSRVERMGKLTDGGWELCDDPLYRPSSGDCLVYSYGINFDFSYDDDMAKYGCEIHAFDPSMKMGPHLHNPLVYFHSSGVGGKNETIAPKGELWQLYTISSHRKMLQHTPEQRRLDIVKMDVEGHELDSLMTALDDGSLSDVQQLVFETHVGWGNYDPPKDEYMKFLALLRKMYEKGFRIYITHRNYLYSAFQSTLFKGKSHAHCHEIHTVNINLKNRVNVDGSVAGSVTVSNEMKQERHNKQMELILQEQAWYDAMRPYKQQKQIT